MSIEILLSDEPFLQARDRCNRKQSEQSQPAQSSVSITEITTSVSGSGSDSGDEVEVDDVEPSPEVGPVPIAEELLYRKSPTEQTRIKEKRKEKKRCLPVSREDTMVNSEESSETVRQEIVHHAKEGSAHSHKKKVCNESEGKSKSLSVSSALVLYKPTGHSSSSALVPKSSNKVSSSAVNTAFTPGPNAALPFPSFLCPPFFMPSSTPSSLLKGASDANNNLGALAAYEKGASALAGIDKPGYGSPFFEGMVPLGGYPWAPATVPPASLPVPSSEQQQQFLAAAASLYLYQQQQFAAHYAAATCHWSSQLTAASSSSAAVQRGRVPLTPTHPGAFAGSSPHSVMAAAVAAAAAVGLGPTALNGNGLDMHGGHHGGGGGPNGGPGVHSTNGGNGVSSNGTAGGFINQLLRAEPYQQNRVAQYIQSTTTNGMMGIEGMCEFAARILFR